MSDRAGTDNRRVLRRLLFLVAGMFGFVFALVPLCNVFCYWTGMNGKTSLTLACTFFDKQNQTD